MDIFRRAIESRYDGRCTIVKYKETDGEINNMEPVTIAENIPCRLSYSSIPSTAETETGAALAQAVKLFLSPDMEVKPGSMIEVTQNGQTSTYKCAGQPAAYPSHQEVDLILDKEWA